jgi:hypothetical protein
MSPDSRVGQPPGTPAERRSDQPARSCACATNSSSPALTGASTRGGTRSAVSPNAISLVQMQAHGLLGHGCAQPLDLRPRFLQFDLLPRSARPPGHRRRERVQRALLGGTAHRHHRGAVHAEAIGRLPLGRLLGENLHEDLVLLARCEPLAGLAPGLGCVTSYLLNGDQLIRPDGGKLEPGTGA